jgi:enoyl-CoA hydratase/carnithine racemase/catechol 2,3-dioxygenase-like lactoylglutathione lyase family enzyme
MTTASAAAKPAQIRVTRRSPAYWRVTIDNPPINVMGPEMVKQFQQVMGALEADEQVRVVVFDSAVDDYFLNHSDFEAKLEDLTSLPAGPTGLPPWPDFLARLTRLPVASIALIRGRATGNGSEITLACDMSFASREKAIISQWEVGVGMVAGGGPMARLPELIGRNRALEVLLSSEDIRADQAEAYGYINRALPDAELDAFVEALATRIAKFDKWAIANTKRLVNTSLPPDVELGAGWDACIASLGRPAAQNAIKALMASGQAGRCGKSARILHRPNGTLDRRPTGLLGVEDGTRSKPGLSGTFRMSVVMFNIFCALHRKEPSMNAVQVEQKSYEMPPREGISIAHFLTVADIVRSARYYEKVFGARVLSLGDGNAPAYLQLANIWMILNVGGGPTPDKPTVTLSVPDPNHINSFMNFRVADIQACYELWKSRGAEFITEPIPKYGEIRCYIRDPDGYIIEVGQSTSLTYG